MRLPWARIKEAISGVGSLMTEFPHIVTGNDDLVERHMPGGDLEDQGTSSLSTIESPELYNPAQRAVGQKSFGSKPDLKIYRGPVEPAA